MASSAKTTVDGSICSLSTLHPDIIRIHILTQLDCLSLAAIACASSDFYKLTCHEKLWQEICTSMWPSLKDRRVQTLISMFPSGHRSLVSDSFPVLDLQPPSKHTLESLPPTTELVSAVDIFYKNNLIFSKVEETETVTGWFRFPPFRIDLLDEKELVATPISLVGKTDTLLKQLEEKLSLSWIIMHSSRRKAVNLSSRWPVSVEQHWLTHDVHVKYAVILAGDQRWGLFSRTKLVECEIMVTLRGKEGGKIYLKEVTTQMKDMEEKNLSGKDSLVILLNTMANGKRRAKKDQGKHMYEEFLARKREMRDKKLKMEKVLNMVCFIGFIAFCSLKLFTSLALLLFQQR